MKSAAWLFVILFSLAACAGTGRVGTGGADSSAGATAGLEGSWVKPSAIEGAIPANPKKVKTRGTVRFGLAEDEDDIASLLEHDDFKDFDLPIVFNDAVKYYIVYFTTEKKRVFANWLKRSRRYVPMIKEILKEHGLPEDLVYLAMIESGFNPKAYSTAKASGPWQFIYETGGRYGLKANFWVDERRDPEKSTVAAAKYLTDLFNQFGHWYLAAAGYNAGERRVEKAIEKHNTNDFWELSKYNALPRETREYIPKLIAASIIAKDPERFGFGSITYENALRFVEVRVPAATLLTAIASANSMDLTEFRSLNPEILRGITPPYTEDYRVKLPSSTNVPLFLDRLVHLSDGERKVTGVVVHKVRKRDTLTKILRKYRIAKEDLYLVNDCNDQIRIKRGMALNIPRFSGPPKVNPTVVASSESQVKDVVEKKRTPARKEKQARAEVPERTERLKERQTASDSRTYHVVRKGETLVGISSRYGVDIGTIVSLNKLKGTKVYPNMKLMLASHKTVKKKGTPPKKTTKATTKRVRVHTVRKGETLTQISSKYGVSVANIKSANRLKDNKLHANMRLKIVTGGEG